VTTMMCLPEQTSWPLPWRQPFC